MNKILLKSLAIVSLIELGQADSTTITVPITVMAGNHLNLENADSYDISAEVRVSGDDDYASTLTATKPVTITTNGSLQIAGNATATFNDTLTIGNGGTVNLIPTGMKVPLINVKDNLTYIGKVFAWATDGSEISIHKKDGKQKALFDISRQTSDSYCTTPVNGNNQTFLEYYNSTADLTSAGYTEELDSLERLQDSNDAKKDDLVNILRTRLTNYLGNTNNSVLKNMKMQDYLVSVGNSDITISDTNEVKYVIDGTETLIRTNESTKNVVEAKDGLSLIRADGTGIFDFYTAFNTQGENSSIPNTAGNSFVQWSDNVQLPLSNETSNNTEFDFKTNFAPSEEYKNDLYITNGVQNVETVKFTGDNSTFTNKVVLNGTLHNVEFGYQNGYISIDATNVTDDIILTIQNGTNSNQGTNNITNIPIVRDEQKVTFSTGDYNTVNFSSADATEKIYHFDTFNMGTGSVINIGDDDHQGITLVL